MNENQLRRFILKIKKDSETKCWNWTAYKYKGYGRFKIKNHFSSLAHRVSHEHFKGSIPEGLTIDHLCRNTACVNPDHLEAVTIGENTKRGDTIPAAHMKKTHCPKGHPYSGENLYVNPKGSRVCRQCKRDKEVIRRSDKEAYARYFREYRKRKKLESS